MVKIKVKRTYGIKVKVRKSSPVVKKAHINSKGFSGDCFYKFKRKKGKDLIKRNNKRNTSSLLKVGSREVSKKLINELEGGEEVYKASRIAAEISRPVRGGISKGGKILKEKTLDERKRKIKMLGEKKNLGKRRVQNMSKETARRRSRKTVKEASKAIAKESSKKVAKETSKTIAKETTKVAVATGTSTVTTPVGGLLIGAVVGSAIEERDLKKTNRNRKIKFFIDKIRSENEQKDSIGKLLKDLILKRVSVRIKQIVSLVLPFLLILFLLVAIACLPVVAAVALIYNSPFAIFLPPLDGKATVMKVTRDYMDEFKAEVNSLANSHTGYDEGSIIYLDYEGTSAVADNYYDIMCIYMVKHGIGDTATVMKKKSKKKLKKVFDDMCKYTTSSATETSENEDGVLITRTVLQVNVTLKTYREMAIEYNFTDEEIKILEEMMKSEYLALIGYEAGSGGESGAGSGNVMSSLSQAEIESIVGSITDPVKKAACSFALSKVGYPYSQDYRDTGNYYDCSSLAYYAYKSAGINISHSGATTAAEEARGLSEAGKEVSIDEIMPGDLIFYSYANNGRYKNISHVAIYVGDGKTAEAVNTALGVVYRDMKTGSIVMVGRPN